MTHQITVKERQALEALSNAWVQYLALPIEHIDDIADFRKSIHDAQARIMIRPTRRFLKEREGFQP